MELLLAFCILFSLFQLSQAQHTSNHALIVSSSQYWFNYRHNANALTIYQILKRNGFHDDNIVLMLADEFAVNSRNVYKNRIHTNKERSLQDADTEIDYRGSDVTVHNVVNILTDRQPSHLPRLKLDSDANLLIYFTGHGGNQFFKFQDVEEILSSHIRDALGQARYNAVLFMADTCQAFTLGDKLVDTPNVTVVGSSLKDESSYAHHADNDLGLSVIERYTYALDKYLERTRNWEDQTLRQALVDPYSFSSQRAHIGIRGDEDRKMREFFVNVEAEAEAEDEEWVPVL